MPSARKELLTDSTGELNGRRVPNRTLVGSSTFFASVADLRLADNETRAAGVPANGGNLSCWQATVGSPTGKLLLIEGLATHVA
jgi:hypothetical protein